MHILFFKFKSEKCLIEIRNKKRRINKNVVMVKDNDNNDNNRRDSNDNNDNKRRDSNDNTGKDKKRSLSEAGGNNNNQPKKKRKKKKNFKPLPRLKGGCG
eukprot:488225_1